MFINQSDDNVKVFLSDTSIDVKELRNNLRFILDRAGIEVVESDTDSHHLDSFSSESLSKKLNFTDCSIHILGNKYENHSVEVKTPLYEMQFQKAKEYNQTQKTDYKVFVWHPGSFSKNKAEPAQEKFINQVRSSIYSNMIFSTVDSPVVFVEDVRSIMQTEQKPFLDIKETDLFFIYNEVDDEEALQVVDLLGDIAKVEKLGIDVGVNKNYSQIIARQLEQSKLGVIYFKRSAFWAIPFIQQVWKITGGASGKTPILLIGDGSHEVNHNMVFNAPNVISQIVPAELIPLEIKVQFDKIINK